MTIERRTQRRIFEACRDGIAVTLRSLLASLPDEDVNEILDDPVEERDTQCTPLIIASLNGHENVVKVLLQTYKPDLEIEGVVEFGGCSIEGTSALWCAAGFGHINVVRTLVGYGADVNHPTRSYSTPLRASCFHGRLDIVRFLVDHGSDVNISNRFNNTCLMIAAYKGHLDIVQYLLSLKCDPNSTAKCGGTALHFAAETGHLEIFKTLLEHGAMLTKNVMGMNPVLSASERCRGNCVEYIVSTDHISQYDKIEALELLGASYANDRENVSLQRAYDYLAWAMRERLRDPENPVIKNILPPSPAYNMQSECKSIEELDRIRSDPGALYMEGLIVRERILGPLNPELVHPIIFRGALYADTARFDRCLALWLHALRLKKQTSVTIRKDLLRFALVFGKMLHVGAVVPFEVIFEVIEIASLELRANKLSIIEASEPSSKLNAFEESDDNMLKILYLLVIATKVYCP